MKAWVGPIIVGAIAYRLFRNIATRSYNRGWDDASKVMRAIVLSPDWEDNPHGYGGSE